MKTAAEYIEDSLTDWPEAPVLVVLRENAVAAVQAALDDAERYRLLLARATRNAKTSSPSTPESGTATNG